MDLLIWNDKKKEYMWDESITSSENLEKDDEEKEMKSDVKMKFDVKKVEELLHDRVFNIQDHDNKFQFCGIFKSVNPDELTFYITGRAVKSKVRGTYTLPVGSHFTLYRMKPNGDNTEWVFAGNISKWNDITETNESKKEEKEMKLDPWSDCVIKDNAWVVNDQIKWGDTIYRLKTDTIDIKGKMTIDSTSYYMMKVDFINSNGSLDNINIEITPDMKVFKTDSEDDPGILVQCRKVKFNPTLCAGKLYWVANDDLQFQYIMHVRAINENSIDVNIINTTKELDNTSSIKIIGKSFDITELLEYKFKEV